MTGKKLNPFWTQTGPIRFCWVFYACSIGTWTVLNLILIPHIQYGYWTAIGASGGSLVMRYHFTMYFNELNKIRDFILLMS
jgi:hypothetical protein